MRSGCFVDLGPDFGVWNTPADASVFLLAVFQGSPEPINVFIVPTRRWSDGTPQ